MLKLITRLLNVIIALTIMGLTGILFTSCEYDDGTVNYRYPYECEEIHQQKFIVYNLNDTSKTEFLIYANYDSSTNVTYWNYSFFGGLETVVQEGLYEVVVGGILPIVQNNNGEGIWTKPQYRSRIMITIDEWGRSYGLSENLPRFQDQQDGTVELYMGNWIEDSVLCEPITDDVKRIYHYQLTNNTLMIFQDEEYRWNVFPHRTNKFAPVQIYNTFFDSILPYTFYLEPVYEPTEELNYLTDLYGGQFPQGVYRFESNCF